MHNKKQTIENIIENRRPELIPSSVKTRILAKIIEALPNAPRLGTLSTIGFNEFHTKENLYEYFSYHYPQESKQQIKQRVKFVFSSPQEMDKLFKCSNSWVVQLLGDVGIKLYASIPSNTNSFEF